MKYQPFLENCLLTTVVRNRLLIAYRRSNHGDFDCNEEYIPKEAVRPVDLEGLVLVRRS